MTVSMTALLVILLAPAALVALACVLVAVRDPAAPFVVRPRAAKVTAVARATAFRGPDPG